MQVFYARVPRFCRSTPDLRRGIASPSSTDDRDVFPEAKTAVHFRHTGAASRFCRSEEKKTTDATSTRTHVSPCSCHFFVCGPCFSFFCGSRSTPCSRLLSVHDLRAPSCPCRLLSRYCSGTIRAQVHEFSTPDSQFCLCRVQCSSLGSRAHARTCIWTCVFYARAVHRPHSRCHATVPGDMQLGFVVLLIPIDKLKLNKLPVTIFYRLITIARRRMERYPKKWRSLASTDVIRSMVT